MSLDSLRLNEFENEVFATASAFLASNADKVGSQLRVSLSCEPFFNHLFAKAFDHHHFICAREVPYVDLGNTTGKKSGLDIMVVAPDKQRSVLIETKLVHDHTGDTYRARAPEHGSSIAGDIEKLRSVPPMPGRTKLVMVVLASISDSDTPSNWQNWLAGALPLREVKWLRANTGDGPLFKLPLGGWVDVLIHRID
jgi:hypothetical protein